MCLQININEVFDNLVLPACAYALMGKAGVILITCTLFMAVTSGGAGEMLAVSSLFTFDVWREYIRPQVPCSSHRRSEMNHVTLNGMPSSYTVIAQVNHTFRLDWSE